MSKCKIGMTDGRMYELYAQWVSSYSEDIEIIRLGYRFDNLEQVKACQALVFTGGEDVHPRRYGRLDYLTYCIPEDFDEQRDDFEWALLQYAEQYPLPILGICRGLQLINVFHGGTLIPDIPTWGKFNHAKGTDGLPREHGIQLDVHGQLYRITGEAMGVVNSLHHQSADRIGKGLVASALSPDGIVEAIEQKEMEGKPFFLLVQWHPERMTDIESPFVRNIGEAFVASVIQDGKTVKEEKR
ncbi:gamma-glutamyl-gamma-aminobutyrate hydrolase family protein [Olivibacter sitiensis]|uniref:gamma-glutamyl-gamma-aminobutyrate hydrolase family protein n=1 Tax=Olivibacter sitiensis TaxID=376470 RepID=UPI0003FE8BE8|nr:gamma-glutamyl-gamma-aminobutyrate hydrolase family protein [Olivibacter sitiensis]